MNPLFCGVDAGGTSSRAVVASADGTQSGWGFAAGANPTHAGWLGAGATMGEAVEKACRQANASPGQVESVFLGMAGVISAEDRARAVGLCQSWKLAPSCRCGADHDIRIALEGGLSGRPGIALIAGTGSSCYGRSETGESWQAGGWDRMLDDLGSGYDLAQKGMAAACQSADGRSAKTVLESFFFGAFGVTNVIDFCVKVHRPGLERHEIAALAPLVIEAARQGDTIALRLVAAAADELARMVEAVTNRLFPAKNPEIVFIGGLVEKAGDYRGEVEKAIHLRLPQAIYTTAQLRPAVGALALAAAQARSSLDGELLKKLSVREGANP